MKLFKTLSISLILALCQVLPAYSLDILIVKSMRIKPYEAAMQSFRNGCEYTVRELILAEMSSHDVVREVLKLNPRIVLAMGRGALDSVKEIKDRPVLYTMVLEPEHLITKRKNITGVSMNVPPAFQLGKFLEIFPGIRRVGILYDKAHTGSQVEELSIAARHLGIELITARINSHKEVFAGINSMKGKIDAYMMLPDVTVVSPLAVEYLLLFSMENKVPVLTFSEKYVAMGAVASMNIDYSDMGNQTCDMAHKLLSGIPPVDVPRKNAGKAVFSVNALVAKKLGIGVGEKITKIAKSGAPILELIEKF